MPDVYLRGDPSSILVGVWGSETGKERKTSKKYIKERVITVGKWNSTPRGPERLLGTHFRIFPPVREEVGVFIHQLPFLIGQRLPLGALTP